MHLYLNYAREHWIVPGDCVNGVGANNTCITTTLGTETVSLFGLNTDGDVNGDDTLYVGLRCDL